MKKIATATALAILMTAANILPSPTAQAKVNLEQYFDLEAHRGGRDARAENTLYAYTYAIEAGATTIDCDMQLINDQTIILSHTPTLNPVFTRNINGLFISPEQQSDLRSMNLAEVKRFNVGAINPASNYYQLHGTTQITSDSAEIPTLEELFQLVKESGQEIYINAEAKSYPDIEDPVAANNPDSKKFVQVFNDLVTKYNMEDKVILQSFDWQTIVDMKKLNPNITTSALWSQQPSWGRGGETLRPYEKEKSPYLAGLHIDKFKGNAVRAAHSIGADMVSPYYGELTKDLVDEAHALGMKVVPWTVNDEQDMEMLYAMGVDGIITDKPWLLRSFLEKKGAALRKTVENASKAYHLEPAHK